MVLDYVATVTGLESLMKCQDVNYLIVPVPVLEIIVPMVIQIIVPMVIQIIVRMVIRIIVHIPIQVIFILFSIKEQQGLVS